MPLIAESTAVTEHTGSTLQGPVLGTVEIDNQFFVTIQGSQVMTEGDPMVIPSHWYAQFPPLPPLFHSHKYPATPEQQFVSINGILINMWEDKYDADPTIILEPGQLNTFVTINGGGAIPPGLPLWPAPYDTPEYIPWKYYW